MNTLNNIIHTQKTASLHNAFIHAGYDMVASQVNGMYEDEDYWGSFMINGKINHRCIDISEQASHSFYSNELDIWFQPNEAVFSECSSDGDMNHSANS